MKIQKKDFYHGAALTQIVEHPSFKALNKADERYGHYQINDNIRLLLRLRSNKESPWIFTFEKEDIDILIEDITHNQKSYLCLVCGKESICLLPLNDYQKLIDVSRSTSQSITIEIPPRSSMHVKSKLMSLNHTISHKDFPDKLFV